MISNGASFGNGQAMDLGSGESYGKDCSRGGRQPASASWMFAVLIFRV
jgi:hypothetical protein